MSAGEARSNSHAVSPVCVAHTRVSSALAPQRRSAVPPECAREAGGRDGSQAAALAHSTQLRSRAPRVAGYRVSPQPHAPLLLLSL